MGRGETGDSSAEGDPQTQLFAIVSWGNAGTWWLTKTLNAHPDIFCVHNLRNHWRRAAKEPRRSATVYLEAIARQGNPYRAAGDVHGLDHRELRAPRARYGERLRVGSLVRHPIPRMRSHATLVGRAGLHTYSIPFLRLRWSLPSRLRKVLRTKQELFFVHMCQMVNSVVHERAAGPVFTVEQLSREPKHLGELIGFVSGGALDVTEEMGERMGERVNPHFGASPDEPEAIYRSWPEWQQRVFAELLTEDARALYTGLGYDLEFVERRA